LTLFARIQAVIYTKAAEEQSGWFVSKTSNRDLVIGVGITGATPITGDTRVKDSIQHVSFENVVPPIAWVFKGPSDAFDNGKLANPSGGFETGWITLGAKDAMPPPTLVPFAVQTKAGSKFAAAFGKALQDGSAGINAAISAALLIKDKDELKIEYAKALVKFNLDYIKADIAFKAAGSPSILDFAALKKPTSQKCSE
jgi:hypothetical protein